MAASAKAFALASTIHISTMPIPAKALYTTLCSGQAGGLQTTLLPRSARLTAQASTVVQHGAYNAHRYNMAAPVCGSILENGDMPTHTAAHGLFLERCFHLQLRPSGSLQYTLLSPLALAASGAGVAACSTPFFLRLRLQRPAREWQPAVCPPRSLTPEISVAEGE
eukprot:6214268-Pleurochrysis_carterae.AAC.2